MNAGNLVMSGVLILAGLIALASPQHVIGWKRRSFARRRVDRWRRGTDAYFEEARQLDAYPPPSDPHRVRLAGTALLILGLGLLAATLFH